MASECVPVVDPDHLKQGTWTLLRLWHSNCVPGLTQLRRNGSDGTQRAVAYSAPLQTANWRRETLAEDASADSELIARAMRLVTKSWWMVLTVAATVTVVGVIGLKQIPNHY